MERVCVACLENGIGLPVYTASTNDVMVMLKGTEASG
jgi:hypothetical protein